jgi:hypothetical protein
VREKLADVDEDEELLLAELELDDELEDPPFAPSARKVCGPTIPSTVSPFALWKSRTALTVIDPKNPVELTLLLKCPLLFKASCNSATSLWFIPWRKV